MLVIYVTYGQKISFGGRCKMHTAFIIGVLFIALSLSLAFPPKEPWLFLAGFTAAAGLLHIVIAISEAIS